MDKKKKMAIEIEELVTILEQKIREAGEIGLKVRFRVEEDLEDIILYRHIEPLMGIEIFEKINYGKYEDNPIGV